MAAKKGRGGNRVRDQYEDFPYPHRDPKDEAKRLIAGSPGQIPEMNHYLFAGQRDFSKPFRVLVAGGGTGDALIMLAQQLADRNCPAEIHYIDLSSASRRIAEKRAKARGLNTITFHSGSLLDVGDMGLGEFDYIDSCGVLHHLPDPQAGFRALAGVLAPGGGMGIMVYGELGRTGVYHAQAMLRMVAGDGPGAKRIDVAKKLLSELPATNWLKRNPHIHDHEQSDAGLFDLLLHSQDRAYTVPQLADEVTAAGLRIVSFIDPARYDPKRYISEPAILARLAKMSDVEQAGFAELLAGNMRKHIVYLTAADNDADTVARVAPDAVPVFLDRATAQQFRTMPPGAQPVLTLDNHGFELRLPPQAAAILAQIDGRSSLEQIRSRMPGAPDWFAFANVFAALFAELNGFGRLFLSRAG